MNSYDSLISAALKNIKSSELEEIPPEDEIDHDFSSTFEKKMEDVISGVGKSSRGKGSSLSLFVRAAVIILCVCMAAFTAVMINPQVRANFKNAVYEFYENHIKFHFVTTQVQQGDFDDISKVSAEYIPTGFDLTDTSYEYEALGYTYENKEEEKKFNIYVAVNDGLSVITDKENSTTQKLIINGREAYCIYSDIPDEQYGTVIITGSKITVTIYGALSKDELVNIALGIK